MMKPIKLPTDNQVAAPAIVLFLAANPTATRQLMLAEECREIQEKINAARFGERISFRSRWAARADDLLVSLLEHEPTVLHFSGHGSGTAGLQFETSEGKASLVTAEMLEQAMRAGGSSIKIVILNACYSEIQGRAVVEQIPCVVAMPQPIADSYAVSYAGGFYRALAYGKSVESSHQYGLAAMSINLDNIGDSERDIIIRRADEAMHRQQPMLLTREGTDPSQVFVVQPAASDPSTSARIHLQFDIDTDYDDLDAATLTKILLDIRRLAGSQSLRIICISKGSVILTLSFEALPASGILNAWGNGKFTHLGGCPVTNVKFLFKLDSVDNDNEHTDAPSELLALTLVTGIYVTDESATVEIRSSEEEALYLTKLQQNDVGQPAQKKVVTLERGIYRIASRATVTLERGIYRMISERPVFVVPSHGQIEVTTVARVHSKESGEHFDADASEILTRLGLATSK